MIGDRDLGRDVVERLVIGEALAVGEGRAPVFGDVEQRRCLGFVRVPRAAGDLELVDRLEDHLRERRIGLVRSEEHTSELQSLMRISYAVFCLKKNKNT